MPSTKNTIDAWWRLAAAAFGTVLGLVLIESGARIFFDEAIQPRFFIDSGYGVRGVKSNMDTRHYVPGDYDVRVRTNSVGMRGTREYSVDKSPGVRRVLIVGDSMSFGFGVEDQESVGAILEHMLNARSDKTSWEVINQSVSGSGQAEQLVTYHAFGRKYRPDAVVLFFCGNDLVNNQVSGLYEAIGDTSVRRTGASYLPGVAAEQLLYAVPPVRWLFEHSAAWNIVRHRLSAYVQRRQMNQKGMAHPNDLTPEAVALTRALIRQFVADIRSDGVGDVILVAIPSVRENMANNLPLTQAELADLGVIYLDGRDFLGRDDFFVRDVHMRAQGNTKVAGRLVDVLQALPAAN